MQTTDADEIAGQVRSLWWGLVADAMAAGWLTQAMCRAAMAAQRHDIAPDPDFGPPLPVDLDDNVDRLVAEGALSTWLSNAITTGHAGRLPPGQEVVLDDLAEGWRALPALAWFGLAPIKGGPRR